MSGIEVHDAGDLRKYRTEIPNSVLDMGLSPYALTLYVHLKRTAGQSGMCFKGTRRLAKDTGISAGKISDARGELEEKKLIDVVRPANPNKAIEVTIRDVWAENFMQYSSRSPHERVHETNTACSPHEHRKEHIEEVNASFTNVQEAAPSPPPTKEEGKEDKKQNRGQLAMSMLLDRYNAAKEEGRKPLVLPSGVRKSLGGYVKQALSEGHSQEEVGLMCDYLVAVACGEVDERKRAWCGFGTAEEAVSCGWRPRSKNGAGEDSRMSDEEWAGVEALMREAGIVVA